MGSNIDIRIIEWIGDRVVTSIDIINEFGNRYGDRAPEELGKVMERLISSGKVDGHKGVFKLNKENQPDINQQSLF